MTIYLSAKELGILPCERKALIAFVTNKAKDSIISVKFGRKHYYDQFIIEVPSIAEDHNCGSAGCIAGYVFSHIKHNQKLRLVRGTKNAMDYYTIKTYGINPFSKMGLLEKLYSFFPRSQVSLSYARKVVRKALQTGEVEW